MRRFATLVTAALLTSATVVAAQPRATTRQPVAKAARTKPPVGERAAAPMPRSVKPPKLDPAAAAILEDAKAFVKSGERKQSISATMLLQQYQRVGRELLLLANEHRDELGIEDTKASCIELRNTFRSIKIDDAVATVESRVATAALLDELREKIERVRGVAVSQECLNNPLAAGCQ